MSGEIQTRRTPGGLKQKRNTRNEKKRQEQLLLDNPVTSTASTEHFDNFESKNVCQKALKNDGDFCQNVYGKLNFLIFPACF